MSRHKEPRASASIHQPTGFKQAGLVAFRRNDFTAAILAWQKLDLATAPEVRAVLAEAHFRRALAARDDPARLDDLQKAVDLLPTEARFWYHLGLAYHRLSELDEAQAAYVRAAELGFSRRAALAFARGLAALESDPAGDLERLDWLTPEDRAALLPIAALLFIGVSPGLAQRRGEKTSAPDRAAPVAPSGVWEPQCVFRTQCTIFSAQSLEHLY